jgi:hypothetical protein
MVDVYKTNRQFERDFLPNTNLSEPPDDRKNFDDMIRYPKHEVINSADLGKEGQLIATIIYCPDNKTVRVERNN